MGYIPRAAGNDVGPYPITKGSLTAGSNYTLTVTPGTLTITAKPITVLADDKTKQYGATDPALPYAPPPAGVLESVDSLSGDLTRAPGKDVGPYPITKGSLTAGSNYTLTVTPGTLTITAKRLTVTPANVSVVRSEERRAGNDAPPAAGVLESGDSLSGDLTRAPGKDVGPYPTSKGSLTAGSN